MTTENPDTTTTAPPEDLVSSTDVQKSLHSLVDKMVSLSGDMRHVLITASKDGVFLVSGMDRTRNLILLRMTVEELEAIEALEAKQGKGPEAA